MENRTFNYAGLCEELREALRTVKADVTVGYNPIPGAINVYRKDVPNEPCTPSVCTLLVRKFDRSSQSTDQQREIEELKGEVKGLQMSNADLEDNINFLKDVIEKLKAENEQLKGEVRGLQVRCAEQQLLYAKKMNLIDNVRISIGNILFCDPESTNEDSTTAKLVKIYRMVVKEEGNDSTNS